jgi:hypothetical protein
MSPAEGLVIRIRTRCATHPGATRSADAPYLLAHRHAARECAVVFAAFKGHDSPLRHLPVIATRASGGREIRWIADAPQAYGTLALLPFYVARRTTAIAVRELRIP